MKPILLRSVLFFLGAVIQLSCVNTLFPLYPVSPPVLLSMVASLTLLKGFSFSWRWAIVGGVLFDAMALSGAGYTAFELLLSIVALNFGMRGILFRYRLERLFVVGIMVWFVGSLSRVVTEMLFLFFTGGRTFSFFSFFGAHYLEFFWSLVASVALFLLVFPFMAAFERYLELFERTKIGR